jgi:F-type H+-transporting ATPase subunit delta
MAELATVARPYAEALFRVAQAGQASGNPANSLAAWSDLVSELAQVASHPEVQAFARNPKVSDADVAGAILALVKSPVSAEAKNFLDMLIENGRISLLPEIGVQFHELKNSVEGAADAEISSAFELSEAQVAELIASLEKKFSRKLNPAVKVDPALIGGVRVVVGDEVLDTSVRAQLEQMRVALTS